MSGAGKLWPLRRSSTREFWREADRVPGFGWLDRFHAWLYLTRPYFYIGFLSGSHPVARWLLPPLNVLWRMLTGGGGPESEARAMRAFAETYHGKVLPLGQAAKLIQVRRDIELPGLERVIPFAKARDLVLRHPDHITLLDCPCRSVREKPCLPLDVCLIVGEPFASFVAEHHPARSRRITPEEAVDVLRAENARGHVAHAFFKDAMLGRFFAICNCCACCCGAMRAHASGVPMLLSSGYVSVVDAERCVGCGLCVPACQFKAISLRERQAVIDPELCMGCGVCEERCPKSAMRLERDESRGEPLDVDVLLAG